MSSIYSELIALERSLTNITPNADQVHDIESLRHYAKTYAQRLVDLCPDSREKSLAKTKLEESVFWGVKAIILHHPTTQTFETMDGGE